LLPGDMDDNGEHGEPMRGGKSALRCWCSQELVFVSPDIEGSRGEMGLTIIELPRSKQRAKSKKLKEISLRRRSLSI